MNETVPNVVTLFVRKNCERCADLSPFIEKECSNLKLHFEKVAVDAYPETLLKRFGERAPVLAVKGRARAWGNISRAWFRRELVGAAKGRDRREVMSVSAVVVMRGRKMLINKRPEKTFYGGWWEWPGGKQEEDESIEQCALRELDEEIGISVGPLTLFDQRMVDYPGRNIALSVFTCRAKFLSRVRSNALEHRWVKPEKVRALKFLEPNIPILERFIKEVV